MTNEEQTGLGRVHHRIDGLESETRQRDSEMLALLHEIRTSQAVHTAESRARDAIVVAHGERIAATESKLDTTATRVEAVARELGEAKTGARGLLAGVGIGGTGLGAILMKAAETIWPTP